MSQRRLYSRGCSSVWSWSNGICVWRFISTNVGATVENIGAVLDGLFLGAGVEDVKSIPGVTVETIPRHHVFVCSHLKRDKRCGAIGPYLVNELGAAVKVRHRL